MEQRRFPWVVEATQCVQRGRAGGDSLTAPWGQPQPCSWAALTASSLPPRLKTPEPKPGPGLPAATAAASGTKHQHLQGEEGTTGEEALHEGIGHFLLGFNALNKSALKVS